MCSSLEEMMDVVAKEMEMEITREDNQYYVEVGMIRMTEPL